jgi:hypothetical protein
MAGWISRLALVMGESEEATEAGPAKKYGVLWYHHRPTSWRRASSLADTGHATAPYSVLNSGREGYAATCMSEGQKPRVGPGKWESRGPASAAERCRLLSVPRHRRCWHICVYVCMYVPVPTTVPVHTYSHTPSLPAPFRPSARPWTFCPFERCLIRELEMGVFFVPWDRPANAGLPGSTSTDCAARIAGIPVTLAPATCQPQGRPMSEQSMIQPSATATAVGASSDTAILPCLHDLISAC